MGGESPFLADADNGADDERNCGGAGETGDSQARRGALRGDLLASELSRYQARGQKNTCAANPAAADAETPRITHDAAAARR